MRACTTASVVRAPLAIALLVAVMAQVRPTLALEFHYDQNANGQPYNFIEYTPAGPVLITAYWPNNNNWDQELHTFVDGVGDTIISEPTNWRVRNGLLFESIDYYPGSPKDPTPTEHDIFLKSVTVSARFNETMNTLNISEEGILNVHSPVWEISLTVTNSLNIGEGDDELLKGFINLDAASLTIGDDSPGLPDSLNISPGSILNIGGRSWILVRGAFNNDGTINLPNVSGADGDLKIADGTTFNGSGRVVLGSGLNNNNDIYGATTGDEELINGEFHTISGGGRLGVNALKLTNHGLIDGNIAGGTMYIDPNAAGVMNTKIIQASEGGIVRLQGGTFTNGTSGLMQALDGSQVELVEATIVGGTLSSSGSGKFVVPGNTFGGLSGTITNNALISVPSVSGPDGDLLIADGTTLNGTGSIVLGGGANNDIYGVATGNEELINGEFHTISGGGRLGVNALKLTNHGLIDGNLDGAILYIDPNAAGVTNTKIIQASEGGIVRLQDGTFTNTGGVIQALDSSRVELINMTLIGGTLSREGTGRIVVPNNTTITLTGPITLDAPLEINSTGISTHLKINGNLTLNENVVLSNNTNNHISGVTETDVLTLPAGRTISGAGWLDFRLMGLVNEGTIDANVSSPLSISPSSAGVTNTGILQASGGGILRLHDGTFTNTGGAIQALDDSQVQLYNMTLVGGTVSRTGTGRIVVPNNATVTLAGPITLNAPLEISSTGSTTHLKFDGNLTLNENVVLSNNTNNRVSGVAATDVLTLPAGRTISGAGQLGFDLMGLVNEGTIDANVSNQLTIDPSSAGVTNTGILQASEGGILRLQDGTFTNTGGLIQALDGSRLELLGGTVNNTGGVVQAVNGSFVQNSATLVDGTLSGAGTGQFVNQGGILRGSGPAGLQLTDGSFSNSGIVEALNGSHVTYSSSAVNLNNVASMLTGGSWRSVATGDGATITLSGTSNITQIGLHTTVELSGAGSVLQKGATPLESTLTWNRGTLQIFNGRAFNMTNPLDNYGIIELGGEGLADATLSTSTLTTYGALMGHGTVVGNVVNWNSVSPGSPIGTLHVTGDYSQLDEAFLTIQLESQLSFAKLNVTGSVALDGMLAVYLANGFMPNANDSFDILDWESRTGTFSTLYLQPLAAGLVWNTSQLYTDGVLSVGAAGDYNTDGMVNAADYVVWRDHLGAATSLPNDATTGVALEDYGVWKQNFGAPAGGGSSTTAAVPEPATLILLVAGMLAFIARRSAVS